MLLIKRLMPLISRRMQKHTKIHQHTQISRQQMKNECKMQGRVIRSYQHHPISVYWRSAFRRGVETVSEAPSVVRSSTVSGFDSVFDKIHQPSNEKRIPD